MSTPTPLVLPLAIQAENTTDLNPGGRFPLRVISGATDGLTAHAGGGQAGATALPSQVNRVTTVATIADSVVLPASVAGLQITVVNAGANSMNVFPATGETINALAANTALAIPAGHTATFACPVIGAWYSIPTAP